jgi:hypothetical protein
LENRSRNDTKKFIFVNFGSLNKEWADLSTKYSETNEKAWRNRHEIKLILTNDIQQLRNDSLYIYWHCEWILELGEPIMKLELMQGEGVGIWDAQRRAARVFALRFGTHPKMSQMTELVLKIAHKIRKLMIPNLSNLNKSSKI